MLRGAQCCLHLPKTKSQQLNSSRPFWELSWAQAGQDRPCSAARALHSLGCGGISTPALLEVLNKSCWPWEAAVGEIRALLSVPQNTARHIPHSLEGSPAPIPIPLTTVFSLEIRVHGFLLSPRSGRGQRSRTRGPQRFSVGEPWPSPAPSCGPSKREVLGFACHGMFSCKVASEIFFLGGKVKGEVDFAHVRTARARAVIGQCKLPLRAQEGQTPRAHQTVQNELFFHLSPDR